MGERMGLFELKAQFKNGLRVWLEKHDNKLDEPYMYRVLQDIEKMILEETLIYTRGNQAKAARMLNVSRSTLNTRMKKARCHE